MSRKGRRPAAALGADAGGTFSKLVLADRGGRVLARARIETFCRRGPQDFIRRLVAAAGALEKKAGVRARACGLALAGDVDSARGRLRFSPNLREFSGFFLRKALERRLDIPVSVENDANAAAWGAYVCESGRRARNLACVTLGTGVGGGLVLGGRLYRGSTGSAGEIGHLCVEAGGARCRCGARGCLEAYAGSYGLVGAARRELAGPLGRKSVMRLRPAAWLTPETLAKAARGGDPAARAAWRSAGRYLGLGISNLVYLLNLDEVVFVGGVSQAGALLLDPIREVLRSRPFRTPFGHVRLRIGRNPDLGAVGAALLGLEEG